MKDNSLQVDLFLQCLETVTKIHGKAFGQPLHNVTLELLSLRFWAQISVSKLLTVLRKKHLKFWEAGRHSTWLYSKKSMSISLCLSSKACPLTSIWAVLPGKSPRSSQSSGLAWSSFSPFHHFLCQFPIAFGVFWAALNPSTQWHALYRCNKTSLALCKTEVVIRLEVAKAYKVVM